MSEENPSSEESPGSEGPEDEAPIPKLPRAPLFRKLSLPAMVRIGMFGTIFYAIIVMREPCADGVSRFITNFDDSDADAGPAPSIETRYPGFELMTAEEALKRWPDRPAEGASGTQAPLEMGDAAATSPQGDTATRPSSD
ncbi:MAG: hypothetical protein GY811_02470 [Myxococcales bacterium]|nr:hypothetical protein [Myxococcales bacterium]